jgi:hypothetical protein
MCVRMSPFVCGACGRHQKFVYFIRVSRLARTRTFPVSDNNTRAPVTHVCACIIGPILSRKHIFIIIQLVYTPTCTQTHTLSAGTRSPPCSTPTVCHGWQKVCVCVRACVSHNDCQCVCVCARARTHQLSYASPVRGLYTRRTCLHTH